MTYCCAIQIEHTIWYTRIVSVRALPGSLNTLSLVYFDLFLHYLTSGEGKGFSTATRCQDLRSEVLQRQKQHNALPKQNQ